MHILNEQDVPKFHKNSPWLHFHQHNARGDPKFAYDNWETRYREMYPLKELQREIFEPKRAELEKFAKDKSIESLVIPYEDPRKFHPDPENEEGEKVLTVESQTQADESAQKVEFNQLMSNASDQGDAEIRFDAPRASDGQRLVFGPDHQVIKVISPVKHPRVQAGHANLLPTEDEELDEEELEEQRTERPRLARIDIMNSADRRETLWSELTYTKLST